MVPPTEITWPMINAETRVPLMLPSPPRMTVMKANKRLLAQLDLLLEENNRWTGFSDEIKQAALDFIAMLLIQIVLHSDSNEQTHNLEDSHAG